MVLFKIRQRSLFEVSPVSPIFEDIELIRKSSCNHPFNKLSFFYNKRAIAATHSFRFTVFLQNRDCSKDTA